MNLGIFDYYLIIINVIGFLLFVINMLLYTFTASGEIDVALTIASVLGGSLGIILAMLAFDRKAEKGNMMSRVFIACMFIIQVIIVLIAKGVIAKNITLSVGAFFAQHKILIIYLVIINFVTLAAFAVDKIAAIEGGWRIRIITLLGLAFIGGSPGGLLAMYLFRHKIRVDYFTVGVPLIMVMQVVVTFYLMNLP